MGDSVRQRREGSQSAAKIAKSSSVFIPTTHERILNCVHELYQNDGDHCLKDIAKLFGREVLAPRRRINVLLVGNHSAGKSSFINWYIEEHIQRTGVAIETQGITFVVSGKLRETFRGNATLQHFKQFQFLGDIEGVVDYLTTEVSTSRQKRFSMVNFIDTPGLVDGGVEYAFDVDKAILRLGTQADLIFVFFDPIGQALCKRTMDLVEKLHDKFADKLKFYLSKADEAGIETDRQRVMMQIVQELCRRPGLNRAGFDMPTIYIPNPSKPSRCVNQIEDTCSKINMAINHTVQNSLDILHDDAVFLTKTIDAALSSDERAAEHNRSSRVKRSLCGVLGFLTGLFFLTNLWVLFSPPTSSIKSASGTGVDSKLVSLAKVWDFVPEEWRFLTLILATLVCTGVIWLVLDNNTLQPRLTRKRRAQMQEARSYVQETVLPKQKQLLNSFLSDAVGDNAA